MGDCACHDTAAETADQRRAIAIALALNLAMFVIGTVAGLLAESASLLADALDMLADASAYGIALLAIGRTATFKQRAATASGLILAALGSGVVLETIHRAVAGSEPEGLIIVGGAMLSLVINASVLRLLHRYRNGEAHLRASWIFTRADVVELLELAVSVPLLTNVQVHPLDDANLALRRLAAGAVAGSAVLRIGTDDH